jgi:ribosomal protein S18 acetylase RimI-like enzyme
MPTDAHAIATLLVRSWRAAYRDLIPEDVLAGLFIADREEFWSGALTAPVPRSGAVVATIADVVVGFAATGSPLDHSDDPDLGHLYALYVDPDLWRRGIGTPLHAAALDRLRSCGFTHAGLWILEGNDRALRFYRRHGWTDSGRTQVDRGPGGTALHERRLVRSLTDELVVGGEPGPP